TPITEPTVAVTPPTETSPAKNDQSKSTVSTNAASNTDPSERREQGKVRSVIINSPSRQGWEFKTVTITGTWDVRVPTLVQLMEEHRCSHKEHRSATHVDYHAKPHPRFYRITDIAKHNNLQANSILHKEPHYFQQLRTEEFCMSMKFVFGKGSYAPNLPVD